MGAFLVPSAWEAEAGVLRQRAAEHGMLVAMANYGAPSGGLAAAGRSSIWNERGEQVLALEAAGAGVGIAWETDDGGWRPVTQVVSEGALEGMVERAGAGWGTRAWRCTEGVGGTLLSPGARGRGVRDALPLSGGDPAGGAGAGVRAAGRGERVNTAMGRVREAAERVQRTLE